MKKMIPSKKNALQHRIMQAACAVLAVSCAAVILCGCTDPTSHDLNNPHDPMADTYVPVPPSHAAVSLVSETRRMLVWQDSSHFESHYLIERKLGESGVYEPIGMMPANCTSFTDSTIIRTDTTYYYRITTIGEGDKKGGLATLSAMLPFPPPASLSLQASLSASSMVLRWTDNSSFEQGFLLERREGSAPYTEHVRTSQNEPAFTETVLDTLKDYIYRVKAFTSNNESRYSNEVATAYFPSESNEIFRSYIYGNYSVVESSVDGRYLLLGGLGVTGPQHDTVDIVMTDVVNHTTFFAKHGAQVRCIAMSRDDRYVASFANDSTIRIWNANDLSPVKSFHFTQRVTRAAYSCDGSKLICSCVDYVVRCLSVEDGHVLYALPADAQGITSLAVSPDGVSFAYAAGGRVESFSIADGSLRRHFPVLPRAVTKLKFGSEHLLGALSGGNRIDLWNSATGEPIQTITGFSTAENVLAFTDDERYVMTFAESPAGIAVWRVLDGRLARVWPSRTSRPPVILSMISGRNDVAVFDGTAGSTLSVSSFSFQWDMRK